MLLGMTLGIVGVMIYTKIRETLADDDAQALIDRLTQNLLELEIASLSTEG